MKDKNTNNSNGNDSSTCLEKWKVEYEKAKQELVIASANANKISRKLQFALIWKNRLEKYWRNIQHTDELANETKRSLEAFESHNSKICINTSCTVTATEILVFETKEACEKADELKALLEKLIHEIDCLNEPRFNPDSSRFYACLDDLQGKLNVVLSFRETALTQCLEAVKMSNHLDHRMSNHKFGLISDV